MYIDFSIITESVFDVDVCIIGAGAAGFSCALYFLNSNLKVLVLEGGLNNYTQQAADLHRADVVGHPHNGIHEARERVVGGTTTKWGGQAYPFMQEDFEHRPYVNMSGWPITLEELGPYYFKAEQVLGTDYSVPYTYRPWESWGVDEPGFSPSKIDLFVTKWCKIPNFAQQHGSKLAESNHVNLLRNANVVEVLPTESLSSVKSLRIKSLNGKDGIVHAKYIIAAGGAIETVRLFLASKKFGEAGIGNGNNLVGSYFQDHISAIVGQIFPKSRTSFHDIFDPFYKKGFKYFPRIKLDPEYARELEILHASAQIVFAEDDDEILTAVKTIVSSVRKKKLPDLQLLKKIINPSKGFDIAKAAFRWKVSNRGSSSKGPIWMEIHSEQEPSRTSCLELSKDLDSLGMPRIRLNWNISPLTIKTIHAMAKLLENEFQLSGLGKVILEPWVEGFTDNPYRWMSDVFHQAGGLRMANHSNDGVVDANCQVFGIDNLYVASSAVFPTSSFSNPTMTTIALAIRISEFVQRRIANV